MASVAIENLLLNGLGWDVLVVWECEARKLTTLAKRLAEFLSSGQYLVLNGIQLMQSMRDNFF